MNRVKEGQQKKEVYVTIRSDKTFKSHLKHLSNLKGNHFSKIIRELVTESYINEVNKIKDNERK